MTDTVIVLLLTGIGLVIVYDILVARYLRPRYQTLTITARIQGLSKEYIAIPFSVGLIVGLVCGHLFGQF